MAPKEQGVPVSRFLPFLEFADSVFFEIIDPTLQVEFRYVFPTTLQGLTSRISLIRRTKSLCIYTVCPPFAVWNHTPHMMLLIGIQ